MALRNAQKILAMMDNKFNMPYYGYGSPDLSSRTNMPTPGATPGVDFSGRMNVSGEAVPEWSQDKIDEFLGGKGWSSIGKKKDRPRSRGGGQAIRFKPDGSNIEYTIKVTKKGFEYDGKYFDTQEQAEAYIQEIVDSRGY